MGVPGAVGGGSCASARGCSDSQCCCLPGQRLAKEEGGSGGGQHLGCTSQSQAISLSSRRDLELQPRSKMLYAAP